MALLSISNIGWPSEADEVMLVSLNREGMLLEIAPTRVWPDWEGCTVESARKFCESTNVQVSSLQALLFKRDDLELFRFGDEGRKALFEHLCHCIDIAAELGNSAKKIPLVFGSPKQRKRHGLSQEEAVAIAVNFFRSVGEYAVQKGAVMCLEPNPEHYGADFMTTAAEAAHIVRLVNSPGIRLTLDTGCAMHANDCISQAIRQNADILHHFQVAERDLGNFGEPNIAWHRKAAAALFATAYAKVISIEMRGGKDWAERVPQAISFVREIYMPVLFRPLRICIVGGGWFGCHLASALMRSGHKITLHESNNSLFQGSSSKNQFRLHLGFHYPRSMKTRWNMQMHYYRFEKEYPFLIDIVPRNIYAIAKTVSLVDFGTYLAVMSSMEVPFKILNPGHHGLVNVEGAIACKELTFLKDAPRDYFENHLKKTIVYNSKVTERNVQNLDDSVTVFGESYDWLVNCTYHQLDLFGGPRSDCFYELCLSLVYKDTKETEPEVAVTIMDGRLCSLYPMKVSKSDKSRYVTLTSVQYTPIKSSSNFQELLAFLSDCDMDAEVMRRRPFFEECIVTYFPSFTTRYKYTSYFTSFKTKPLEESDNRQCFVERKGRIIDVWSGKINAIFDAEGDISAILGSPVKQPLGRRAALIGFTGFVGSSLARLGEFSHFYNSKNIHEIQGQHFDIVFCAGAPGVKWKANKDPVSDKKAIKKLTEALSGVSCGMFVLMSTIDVYPVIEGQAEEFPCDSIENHPYGRNRLELEHFALKQFPKCLVVRLPALFGAGLKKNYIFDLVNNRNLEQINPDTKFQWYDMADLMSDVTTVLARNHLTHKPIRIVNFFTEPLYTGEIIDRFFSLHEPFIKPRGHKLDLVYDLWTSHGALFASITGRYMRSSAQMFEKLERFLKCPYTDNNGD